MAEVADQTHGYEAAREAASALLAHIRQPVRVGIVLGTGLGPLADQVEDASTVAYADIPHFPAATVAGHAGRCVVGTLEGVRVAALQGRFHLYEGYAPSQVVFPIRVLRLLGAETLIVTNAAGGLAPDLAAGALLLLRDHINLPGLAGLNPLAGANDERFGPRFPPMADAYDLDLRQAALAGARAAGIPLREGTYAMVGGPNFETGAELRFLRQVGADAVGMSTAPEVVAARHMGMRVLALSCVTNAALAEVDSGTSASHEAVLAAADRSGVSLERVLRAVLAHIAREARATRA